MAPAGILINYSIRPSDAPPSRFQTCYGWFRLFTDLHHQTYASRRRRQLLGAFEEDNTLSDHLRAVACNVAQHRDEYVIDQSDNHGRQG